MLLILQIKETNLAKHCKCAGDFTNMLSIDDFGQKLQTFRNIARWAVTPDNLNYLKPLIVIWSFCGFFLSVVYLKSFLFQTLQHDTVARDSWLDITDEPAYNYGTLMDFKVVTLWHSKCGTKWYQWNLNGLRKKREVSYGRISMNTWQNGKTKTRMKISLHLDCEQSLVRYHIFSSNRNQVGND